MRLYLFHYSHTYQGCLDIHGACGVVVHCSPSFSFSLFTILSKQENSLFLFHSLHISLNKKTLFLSLLLSTILAQQENSLPFFLALSIYLFFTLNSSLSLSLLLYQSLSRRKLPLSLSQSISFSLSLQFSLNNSLLFSKILSLSLNQSTRKTWSFTFHYFC
jgi:hypothetical protein